ncbi:MAG: hypothetical protein HY943_21150 [Gammaproteobacteria bacterium]|nr:hypothetical protein [Gammaproteobacteria bacterium]
MRDDSREYLRRALEDCRTLELRHEHEGRWTSGLFDDPGKLMRAIDERAALGSLYTSLNRPVGVVAMNAMHTRALRDDDIGVITRVVLDLDPQRPQGTPSTAAELTAAVEARGLVVRLLAAHDWPTPALAISGNGAHVIYRSRFENAPPWRQRAAVLYGGLRSRLQPEFDALGVSFDVTVRNPGRIWRLYGATNRKGTPTAERTHRKATVTLPAGAWQIVPAAIIERTVRALTPVVEQRRQVVARARGPITGAGDYGTLDVAEWFRAHDAYLRPLAPGKHAVRCPWRAEHTVASPATGSDSVIWEMGASGWPTFHCAHSHCDGRTLRDVIARWGDADQFCARAWSRDNG